MLLSIKKPLHEVLGSLSISCASSLTFKQIVSEGYDTIERILNMTVLDLSAVGVRSGKRIGHKKAERIWGSLHSERVSEYLKYVEGWVVAKDVEVAPIQAKEDIRGLSVCFTGSGPLDRKTLTCRLEAYGAIIHSTVRANTNILLVDTMDAKSSKAKAAQTNGFTKIRLYSDIL